MLCPVCELPMVIVEYEGVELDLCIDGHGTWFDDQELRILFESIDAPKALHDLESRLQNANADGDHGPRRPCPRCGAKMDHVRVGGGGEEVILDRCPHGHGFWFDPGELHQILASELPADHPALARIRDHLKEFEIEPPAQAEETQP